MPDIEDRDYHSAFRSGLGVLLWPYRNQIEIREEVVLKKQGIRMDRKRLITTRTNRSMGSSIGLNRQLPWIFRCICFSIHLAFASFLYEITPWHQLFYACG